MKVVIIEDEIPASNLLKNILQSINPSVEIVKVISSVSDSISFLRQQNDFDILFLDVELSDGSSFEIFKKITEFTKPIVITSAYQNYALDAFSINSIAYVLKPISKKSIEEALEKVRHYKNLFNQNELRIWPQSDDDLVSNKKFVIRLGNKIIPIEQKDISAFYSKDKTTFVSTTAGKDYPLNYSLDDLEKKMNPNHFFRVNRKLLLARDQIVNVVVLEKSKLQLITAQKLSIETNVSSEKSTYFKDWFGLNK